MGHRCQTGTASEREVKRVEFEQRMSTFRKNLTRVEIAAVCRSDGECETFEAGLHGGSAKQLMEEFTAEVEHIINHTDRGRPVFGAKWVAAGESLKKRRKIHLVALDKIDTEPHRMNELCRLRELHVKSLRTIDRIEGARNEMDCCDPDCTSSTCSSTCISSRSNRGGGEMLQRHLETALQDSGFDDV